VSLLLSRRLAALNRVKDQNTALSSTENGVNSSEQGLREPSEPGQGLRLEHPLAVGQGVGSEFLSGFNVDLIGCGCADLPWLHHRFSIYS